MHILSIIDFGLICHSLPPFLPRSPVSAGARGGAGRVPAAVAAGLTRRLPLHSHGGRDPPLDRPPRQDGRRPRRVRPRRRGDHRGRVDDQGRDEVSGLLVILKVCGAGRQIELPLTEGLA